MKKVSLGLSKDRPDGSLDVARLRSRFPIFSRPIRGKRLVYLDSAASCQKPDTVLDTIDRFYREDYSNIHRGVHFLSERATVAFEGGRKKVADYIGAKNHREIVFLRGATEAINLVASSWGDQEISARDEILISEMEHHSNIVPWQMLARRKGARIKILPVDDAGDLRLDMLPDLLNDRTRLVALAHVSNALGTVNDLDSVIDEAHQRGVPVLVDAAQSFAHHPVDVSALDCDFLVASAHKAYGPTGTGFLWARSEILQSMPPYQGGGNMIRSVTFDGTLFDDPPWRFEAGTPDIGGVIGFGAALDFITQIGRESICAHEERLLTSAVDQLMQVDGLTLIGTPRRRASAISFTLDGIHPHDAGTVMDHEGVAVRVGHHCAQPLMERFGVPATIRASFGCYNDEDDIEDLLKAITRTKEMLG